MGGSATTDGGFGAIRAINAISRLKRVELLVACDVTTAFLDAATVFGPQKGASSSEVKLLSRRLDRIAQLFDEEFGVDVTGIEGGGAAGGLGGALAALGGRLLPGFELVADELDLYDHLEGAALVITGEGRLDRTSFDGKVIGGVAELAEEAGVPVAAVVGSMADDLPAELVAGIEVVSLVDRFGEQAAFAEPKRCVEQATAELLARR